MEKQKIYRKNNFVKLFNSLARYKHRYEVFRDFVTVSAIALHNAVRKNETLEEEYLQIVKQYDKQDVNGFCQLLAILVALLESRSCDVLGGIYMDLDLGNGNTGQFFSPPEISSLMAQISYSDRLKDLDKPSITLSEPHVVLVGWCWRLRK